jgi:nucleoside-triphosphatase THEP1
MRKNILITGIPKSGKSTILKKIIEQFPNKVGFVTNEILYDNKRVGFEIEITFGKKSILAHINFQTDFKVSKYYVDINNLDLIIPEVVNFSDVDLLYIDEIAEMELYSDKFKELVNSYLNSKNICIATLSSVYEDEFIQLIKNRDDVILIEISLDNRDVKKHFIELLITKIAKAKKYLADSTRFVVSSEEIRLTTDHGVRTLKKHKHNWDCNCDFFKEYSICSHLIALEEYLK